MNKTLVGQYENNRGHWVGDGFPVRSLFSYNTHGEAVSPFLLLDFAGPYDFSPTTSRRGVGEHPHRGFETVTMVYEGGVSHRDSAGNGGTIGPGDVQWMTAGGGILHDEYHAPDFAKAGGTFHVIQLWVNLPAKDKMTPPAYQGIVSKDIPAITLPDGQSTLRIIAGNTLDHKGPARTFTPVNLWDLRLAPGANIDLDVPEGHTTMVVGLTGEAEVLGKHSVGQAQMLMLSRDGAGASFANSSKSEARLLILTGEPIDEPIAGYGPFVMNNEEELQKAFEDFNKGNFGKHLE